MMKKTVIASALALSMGFGAAQAAPMTSATFTMFDGAGGSVPTGTGGPDNTVTGSIGSGAWAVASTTTFFGANWTAAGGTTFGPGTYDVDTTNGAGAVGPTGTIGCTAANNACYTGVVVGAGQVGGHILFNWGATSDIDVVQVWDVSTAAGVTTYTSTDATVSGGPAVYTIGGAFTAPDGILGVGMIDGAFIKYHANFDFTTAEVPVPAAVWLFGSGLLGLVGVARRKKAA